MTASPVEERVTTEVKGSRVWVMVTTEVMGSQDGVTTTTEVEGSSIVVKDATELMGSPVGKTVAMELTGSPVGLAVAMEGSGGAEPAERLTAQLVSSLVEGSFDVEERRPQGSRRRPAASLATCFRPGARC